MRVHGTIKIKRRELQITDWKKHKQELEEDFQGICGYCGKHFKATLCDSQIEHFIPKKKYPDYENKYSNLVLSCKVCNNKKRSDWPSNDPQKNVTDDKTRGYIDPAMDEFDDTLERCEDGSIIGKTSVGKYMAQRMGFDYRPIGECYKIKQIYESIALLHKKSTNGNCTYNNDSLIKLYQDFEELRQQIHMAKE